MKKATFILTLIIHLMMVTPVKAEVFPISTEMQIGRIKNIVDRAPRGIFLIVGGERAFRGASMFEKIDHLIIVDISPIIIRYNKINIELLKATDKETYKHLRWESNFSAWQKISKVLKQDDFKWWNDHIRNGQGYRLPEQLNRYGHGQVIMYLKIHKQLMTIFPKISKKFNNYEKIFLKYVSWEDIKNNQIDSNNSLTKEEFDWFEEERKYPGSCIQSFIDNPSSAIEWGHIIDYKSGNYLFDDALYQRLHNLALSHKIIILQADLSKLTDIDLITSTIQKLGSKLSILDLNNLYTYDYMGEERFRIALNRFLELGKKESILVLMHNYQDYPCAQFSIYFGFTFENVHQWSKDPFLDVFINELPADILPLLDGRLYEGKDELPLYLVRR